MTPDLTFPMKASTSQPRLRLRCPADVVEAVPYLLGFHPAASVVLLSLHGPLRRLGVVMRADLPAPGGERVFASQAAARLAAEEAGAALLVLYLGNGNPPRPRPRAPVVDALRAALAERGVVLVHAICVGEERWWSFFCDHETCCPAEGVPLTPSASSPGDSPVAAEAAFAGLVALPDRQAVADTLRPVGFLAARAMAEVFERVEGELCAGLRSTGRRDRDESPTAEERLLNLTNALAALDTLTDESLHLLRSAVNRFAAGDQELSDHDVARLVLGLRDTDVRDHALEWIDGTDGDAAHTLWRHLARRSVPPASAVPYTLLAWSAWSRGDGVLARMAVDHALRGDPAYPLAQLLEQTLEAGMHPRYARQVVLMMQRTRCREEGMTHLAGGACDDDPT